jgi:AcrR family transcriptional regulator
MARKTARKTPRRPTPSGAKSDRERVVDAFMALLAEKPIEQIAFTEIAARAKISPAELRGLFDSKIAIVAAHMKEVDRAVLAGGDADMAEEPPRERLFDVLMRRLEVLRCARCRARRCAIPASRWP